MLPTGTLTFLFSDIEGSTRLVQALGAGYPAVLERHQVLLRAAFDEAGGVEVATEGDSFFVVFRSALAAVGAAAAAHRALAAEPWPADAGGVRVRMGLHTGEAMLGGDNYVGLDVHRAARIGAAAHGGQVLISDMTRGLVAGSLSADLSLRDLGEYRLKDLDQPERLFQLAVSGLTQEFPPPRTLETPTNLPAQVTDFIGRKREVQDIADLVRHSRLLTLTGPGGTGKTRLALQVASQLRGSSPAASSSPTYRCSPILPSSPPRSPRRWASVNSLTDRSWPPCRPICEIGACSWCSTTSNSSRRVPRWWPSFSRQRPTWSCW